MGIEVKHCETTLDETPPNAKDLDVLDLSNLNPHTNNIRAMQLYGGLT